MIPGSGIFSGAGAIGGADVQQNPDYGQPTDGSVNLGANPMNKPRRNRFRDAVDAASKFKSTTDYKARKEAKEKEAAQRQTMKIADDISVMEGYTDPGFTLQGQQGTRGRILGGIGSAVGGFIGGPVGGQVGGMIGSSFG